MQLSRTQQFLVFSLIGALLLIVVGIWLFVLFALGVGYGWAYGTGRLEKWLKEPVTPVESKRTYPQAEVKGIIDVDGEKKK